MTSSRFSSDAGIAIGPILFLLAILGLIATVMSASSNSGFGTAGNVDRINADITNQANLIRAKVNECYMQYLITTIDNSQTPCGGDHYPCSDQTNGTLASALTCPGDPLVGGAQQSVWTGARVTQLPPATRGFSEWYYMNAGDSGGRCIWTKPDTGNNSTATVAGLKMSAKKFSSQELHYDPTSSSQKFVVMITPASGTLDSHCTAP